MITVVRSAVRTHAMAARTFVSTRPETLVTTMMSTSYMAAFSYHAELPAAVMAGAYVVEAVINYRKEGRGVPAHQVD